MLWYIRWTMLALLIWVLSLAPLISSTGAESIETAAPPTEQITSTSLPESTTAENDVLISVIRSIALAATLIMLGLVLLNRSQRDREQRWHDSIVLLALARLRP